MFEPMKRKRMTTEDGKAITKSLMGVVAGPWKIANLSDGELYIGHKDGEGGVFDESKFAKHVREFWKREF